MIREWWTHPAPWWQFWYPQSGLVGGLLAAAVAHLLLGAVALLLLGAVAHAGPCYADAASVRQTHPGAWPSYTLRDPARPGARCWYPGARATAHTHAHTAERKVMQHLSVEIRRQDSTTYDTRPRPAPSLAGAAVRRSWLDEEVERVRAAGRRGALPMFEEEEAAYNRTLMREFEQWLDQRAGGTSQ